MPIVHAEHSPEFTVLPQETNPNPSVLVQLAFPEYPNRIEVALRTPSSVHANRMMSRFIRYIVHQKIRHSPRHVGLFAAAYHVRRECALLGHDRTQLARCLSWFERALTVPPRGTIPPHAIFWYGDAGRFSQGMWELARIVEEYGFTTELITARSIGRIVYRDSHQFAAIPPRRGLH